MLKELKEEDFAVLRGPLESGRQSPTSFSAILLLSVFLQSLTFVLTYVVAADETIFPYKDQVFVTHLVITAMLIILSVVYAIPAVFKKGEKFQYLLSILVSQNLFGVLPYFCSVFIIGQERRITEQSLLQFTAVSLLFGLIVFILTCVRFLILLKKGAYRRGSSKDKLRSKYERGIKTYLPIIITGSLGVVFILQFLIRSIGIYDLETAFMMVLFILLFYAMLFVLPEQLVILYCKYRFDSFNFNQKGNLKPLGRKGA